MNSHDRERIGYDGQIIVKHPYGNAEAHSHATRLQRENDDLRRDAQENTRTILFLARLIGKTLGERDRARETAVTLEQELAVLRADPECPTRRILRG